MTYRECENCYECVNIQKCYQVFYSLNCANCSQSSFLYDCLGCDNCIGCRNLRNKSYHIFDQPVSKEAFEEKKKEIFTSHTSTQKFFQEFLELVKSKAIHKYYIGEHNENVTGSYLFDCKNCKNIYFGTNCEEVSNTYRVYNQKDSQYMNGCTE